MATTPAWGHSFPAVRSVVIQLERCEVAVMVGFQPEAGESTDHLLVRAASQPRERMLDALKHLLAAQALAPLAITVDSRPAVPTSVRAKIGLGASGARPIVVVLVTYALPPAGRFAVSSRDPRTTRISWTDRASGRVDLDAAPGQGRWFSGVASFLLNLRQPTGDSACASSIP